MSTPPSMPTKERRTAGVIGISVGLLGTGGLLWWLLRSKGTSSTGTPPGSPTPPQVTGIVATATGLTTATISWSPPAVQSTTPIQYVVQHTDSSGNVVTAPMGNSPATVTTQATSVQLSGLQSGASLSFTVQACLTGGAGEMATTCGTPSAVQTITMPQASVPQVAGVSAVSTGQSTATISWSPIPLPAGATGVSYTVTHTDASGNPTNTPMGNSPATVTTTSTSIQLTGLTPGAQLHFDVMACVTY